MQKVKLRRRTPLQAGGACEAPPHEGGTRLCGHKPMLNTHALYPSRCKQRGIAFKINTPQLAAWRAATVWLVLNRNHQGSIN
jgi:hypothetical protein